MKILKIIGFISVGVLIGYIIFHYNFINYSEARRPFWDTNLSFGQQITCTYPQTLSANYSDNFISHSLNKPETNPLIFTFSDLENSETGQLSYIDATKTITNVPLLKLVENEEKIVYIEGTGENYITVHTIYKNKGVSTYTKNTSLLGIPILGASMGDCVGY